jgi:hypothetical protein
LASFPACLRKTHFFPRTGTDLRHPSDANDARGTCYASLSPTVLADPPLRTQNNQAVGSVTNRINLLAHHAAKGLALHHSGPSSSAPMTSLSLIRSIHDVGLRSYLTDTFRLAVFKVVLFAVDVGFLVTRVRAWCAEKMGKKGEGLEDLLQRQVTVRLLFPSFLLRFFEY